MEGWEIDERDGCTSRWQLLTNEKLRLNNVEIQ